MSTRDMIERQALIAIIRVDESSAMDEIVKALKRGGCGCIEVTMTTPGALSAISEIGREHDDVVVGAGTVIDAATARMTIEAGARFVVTPTVKPEVAEAAREGQVLAIVGAMTPTEALTAWEAGADMVKIFPSSVGGPEFVHAMRGPLPQIPLVPTGGITADNAGAFIKAGAVAVCAGSWLVDKKAIAEGRYEELTKRARALVEAVREARVEVG